MIYSVDVDGERVTVEVTPDGVRVDGGAPVEALLSDVSGTPIRLLRVGAAVYEIVPRRGRERGQYTITIGGDRLTVEALDERSRAIRELARSAAATGPAPLRAPMPGLIVRVYVAPGDSVQSGQPLVAMEAMKMENELRAPAAGTVRAVHITAGVAVEKGTVLVELQ